MKGAYVRKHAHPGRLELPRLAGGDLLRIESAGLRRRGVRERVLVDPDDGLATFDRQRLRLVLQAFDDDGVRDRLCGGGTMAAATAPDISAAADSGVPPD